MEHKTIAHYFVPDPTPYIRMSRDLTGPLPAPVWPQGAHIKPFTENHAPAAHALLQLAYAKGGGSVPSFVEWWAGLSTDSEYDRALCFPVYGGDGALIAFVQCWTGNFIKDLAVHPQHRKRGFGRALLLHIFHVFQERGAKAVELKVETDNPTGAIKLYDSLGMRKV